VKNILITSMINKVLYLSPTYAGKVHDKNICDEERLKFEVPVILWEDLGFIGLNPANADVRRPHQETPKERTECRRKDL
jgi:hypothetical protein